MIDKIATFKELLLKWQQKINLISSETIPQIQERHVEDSLVLVPYIEKNKIIVDLGSGAGFPGIILGIHGYAINLIESDYRKCSFLKEAARILNLQNVTVHNCRIEDYKGLVPDIVTSRALASLDKLLHLSQIVSRETISECLFHKGENFQTEIDEAKKNWIFDKEVFSNPKGGVILRIRKTQPAK